MPKELRENCKKLMSLASTYHSINNKAEVLVKTDHIIVNKDNIKDLVGAPKVQDVLYMDLHNSNAIANLKLTRSGEVREKGSTFLVFTAQVKTPEETRIAGHSPMHESHPPHKRIYVC